ncbi:YebC/PmpR family DNA-binding transcriptional regulator [Candidatus Kaiserbacteria bacterium CG10_big_fil_rev_8_21_14_0_10_56_12]|uniref:YebC/PmpR family DNA-binding transcriptional regulator n=1 Tax=Candidatus Kaiserbacteria bacterium CG10_big_fil_rev_8_21_14_0_10_56_12 TaxID=1974611 RepID=A0A2H0UA23_9BACT|nr:MAG: YebC/PmpR family DNA-binding transcriptional regulator [Candidatus Kaiserbacteria bacterium CG10_big_fil_rev_8_21_14_0_10_56_12]
MSGHSKWSQIKRQKGVTDAARSREFTRYARLIMVESKKAAGNVTDPGLAAAISRAKAANMPKDNIERAVAKGASKDASSMDAVQYEAYGPAGTALIVNALTDNKNRTTQEIKHLLSKQGVELATPGAASWAFTKVGGSLAPNEPLVEAAGADEERLGSILNSLDEHDDVQSVYTNARGYENIGD